MSLVLYPLVLLQNHQPGGSREVEALFPTATISSGEAAGGKFLTNEFTSSVYHKS